MYEHLTDKFLRLMLVSDVSVWC